MRTKCQSILDESRETLKLIQKRWSDVRLGFDMESLKALKYLQKLCVNQKGVWSAMEAQKGDLIKATLTCVQGRAHVSSHK